MFLFLHSLFFTPLSVCLIGGRRDYFYTFFPRDFLLDMGRFADRYSSLIFYAFFLLLFTWNQSVFFTVTLEYFFRASTKLLSISFGVSSGYFLSFPSYFYSTEKCYTQSNIEQLKPNPGVVNTKTVSFLQHRNWN